MFSHNTKIKIDTIRSRDQSDDGELEYLSNLSLQGYGCSDFVDELTERYAARRSYEGGNDRELHRDLSYAGLAPANRRY